MKKRIALVALALAALAGCGGSSGKPSCSTGSCAAGSFCAHTPDGNVCWADLTPPVISAASVECSATPCLRDSVLTVSATATDESYGNAMGPVKVAFETDPTHSLTLQHASGDTYTLEVPLAELPFPFFEHDVVAKVTASDEAGNGSEPYDAGSVGVTRGRWTKQLKGAADIAFPLFAPAVLNDGRVLVAGSDGSLHFVGKNGQETRSAVPLGGALNSPPAVGSDAIWLAAPDGKLLKRAIADGAEITLANCSATQSLVGPPAVSGTHAFVGSVGSTSRVLIAAGSAGCNKLALPSAVTSPPALDAAGHIFFATGAALRSCSYDTAEETLSDRWTGVPPAPAPATLTDTASAGLAVDADGSLWTISQNGAVTRSTADANTTPVTSLSAASTGGIVLSDGSAVFSDAAQRLVRVRASGSVPWATSDALTGVPTVGLALNGATPGILVATDQGNVYLVDEADGHVRWTTQLSGQSLQPPNIWTEPGAATSTAYLAGADGNLYAIIVDGALDTSAPWPKAFHDPQNTSNAQTQP